MRIVLWDVDGTLLLTGGAGLRAFSRAFRELDLPDSMEGVDPSGKTDPQIVREILVRLGIEHRLSEILPAFVSLYLAFFREELAASERFRVLPGVRELVSRLAGERSVLQGLATGNLEEAAYLKLERAGLSPFFSFGGFGSDAENRTELIRVALSRARTRVPGTREDSAFVIGDTPLDILHGKANGARTIAVASGSHSRASLAAHAPDLLVDALEPMESILDFVLS